MLIADNLCFISLLTCEQLTSALHVMLLLLLHLTVRDKMFPALGFGAKLPNGTVSHEFYLVS